MLSDSYHIESNGTSDLCRDKNGRLLEGTVITEDGVIRRFHKGLLDGDSWTAEGRRITQPAVGCPGHLEYWREGRLHRDQGLPREDPETSGETGQNPAGGNGNSPLDEV